MATPAQITANRANSQHSTGPISPDGKSVSALNRLNHGFRSATVLLPGDDPAEYEALLSELDDHFEPRDLTETRLIREMADAEWRLRRIRRHMESAFSRHIAVLTPLHPSLDPLQLQSLAAETLQQTGCSLGTWLRYETKFERQYDRAYAAWARYQDDQRAESRRGAGIVGEPAQVMPALRHSGELASNVQNASRQPAPPQPTGTAIPRSSPCSCGSGDKYKRCCGRNAPPVLHSPGLKSTAAIHAAATANNGSHQIFLDNSGS